MPDRGGCPFPGTFLNEAGSMLIRRAADIRSSDITDKRLYHGRREFLQAATGSDRPT